MMAPPLDAALKALPYARSCDIDKLVDVEKTLQVDLGTHFVVLDHFWVVHFEFHKMSQKRGTRLL
jgi:hypothetical protein